jgi:hypothetical protein
MNTLKYILWAVLAKIPFLYLLLITVNIFSALSTDVHEWLAPVLCTINAVAGISFIALALFVLQFGMPCRKKCEKCRSSILVSYRLESGDDKREPERYEHFYNVTECPLCGNKKILHIKSEKGRRFA